MIWQDGGHRGRIRRKHPRGSCRIQARNVVLGASGRRQRILLLLVCWCALLIPDAFCCNSVHRIQPIPLVDIGNSLVDVSNPVRTLALPRNVNGKRKLV